MPVCIRLDATATRKEKTALQNLLRHVIDHAVEPSIVVAEELLQGGDEESSRVLDFTKMIDTCRATLTLESSQSGGVHHEHPSKRYRTKWLKLVDGLARLWLLGWYLLIVQRSPPDKQMLT
eukprot:6129313-Amphidinium_carterae.2